MEKVKKVYDFLENAGTFYLATVEGDQPRVRPYGAMLFYEGMIYIMAFGKTNATRQIAANCKAEICAFKGVMYYLKDAKANFFKMMELVETVVF